MKNPVVSNAYARIILAQIKMDDHAVERLLQRTPLDVLGIIRERIDRLEKVAGKSDFSFAFEVYKFPEYREVEDQSKSPIDELGFTNASNGDMIVAIFRQGVLKTIMLRRSPESPKPQQFSPWAFHTDYAFRWNELEAALS